MRGPAGQASLRNRTVLGVFFGKGLNLWGKEASRTSWTPLGLRGESGSEREVMEGLREGLRNARGGNGLG